MNKNADSNSEIWSVPVRMVVQGIERVSCGRIFNTSIVNADANVTKKEVEERERVEERGEGCPPDRELGAISTPAWFL